MHWGGLMLWTDFTIICNSCFVAGRVYILICGIVVFPATMLADPVAVKRFITTNRTYDNSIAKFPILLRRPQIYERFSHPYRFPMSMVKHSPRATTRPKWSLVVSERLSYRPRILPYLSWIVLSPLENVSTFAMIRPWGSLIICVAILVPLFFIFLLFAQRFQYWESYSCQKVK